MAVTKRPLGEREEPRPMQEPCLSPSDCLTIREIITKAEAEGFHMIARGLEHSLKKYSTSENTGSALPRPDDVHKMPLEEVIPYLLVIGMVDTARKLEQSLRRKTDK